MTSESTSGKRVLCLVSGLPYSGKTIFARYLCGLRHYPHLEQDALFPQFIKYVKTSPAVRELFQYRRRMPEEQFAGRMTAIALEWYAGVVANTLGNKVGAIADTADLFTHRNRTYFLQKVGKQPNVTTEMYWIDTDLETCLQRYKEHKAVQSLRVPRKREKADVRKPITETLLREWHRKAQLPVEEEGFDRVFYVSGISPKEFDIREQK